MSLADSIIRAAAPAYNLIHADLWRIESGAHAGEYFQGDAQTESVVSLDTELGSDAREKTMLFVDRPIPAGLNRSVIINGKGCMWRMVGDIDDNPGNDRVKFEIVKIVANKDA